MRSASKHKVSSGRLTGVGRGQAVRKRVTAGQSQKSPQWPSTVPSYSLYSTDSEDQVTTIHKGLDHCTTLLDCILQAERTEAKPSLARVLKNGAAKSRMQSSLRKECTTERKKTTTKTVAKKVPAAVQKTTLSSRSKGGPVVGSRRVPPAADQLSSNLQCQPPALNLNAKGHTNALDTDGGGPSNTTGVNHQSNPGRNALFNCRPTTSTPTLSPAKLVPATATPQPNVIPKQAPSAGAGGPGNPMVRFNIGACNNTLSALATGGEVPSHPQSVDPQAQRLTQPSSGASCCCVVNLCELHRVPLTHEAPASPDAPTQPPGPPLSLVQPCPSSEDANPSVGPALTLSLPHAQVTPCSDQGRPNYGQCLREQPMADGRINQVANDDDWPTPNAAAAECTVEERKTSLRTVQYLLGELKAQTAGQGRPADERLLSDLEQTLMGMLPGMVGGGSSTVQAEIASALQPLHNENTQLRRRVKILNQQLQERERAERQRGGDRCDSEVLTLQAELCDIQSQMGKLREEVTALRQALRDTEGQLQDREAENGSVTTECPLQPSEVLLLAQQRLEEMDTRQTINSVFLDRPLPAVESSASISRPQLTKLALDRHERRQDPSQVPSNNHVHQYLGSLGRSGHGPGSPPCKGPTSTTTAGTYSAMCAVQGEIGQKSLPGALEDDRCTSVSEEVIPSALVSNQMQEARLEPKRLSFAPLREMVPSRAHEDRPLMTSSSSDQNLKNVFQLLRQSQSLIAPHLDHSNGPPTTLRQLYTGTESPLDSTSALSEVGTVLSDWSAGSGSTFDTRDEIDFRNGLEALDASIASLQKTIKMDLVR